MMVMEINKVSLNSIDTSLKQQLPEQNIELKDSTVSTQQTSSVARDEKVSLDKLLLEARIDDIKRDLEQANIALLSDRELLELIQDIAGELRDKARYFSVSYDDRISLFYIEIAAPFQNKIIKAVPPEEMRNLLNQIREGVLGLFVNEVR